MQNLAFSGFTGSQEYSSCEIGSRSLRKGKLRGMFPFSPRTRETNASSFGYAIVGLGKIAEMFLTAIAGSSVVHASAMVSGSLEKANSFGKRYGAAHRYTYADFERIADNPEIHGVYLALPVTLHREFTERAARAGKHVLCEKPMAPRASDCQAMVDACRNAGVKLSMAYRCPHDVIHQRTREIVQSGVLGEIRQVESQFGFALGPGWRMNPQEGGSIYDLGVYPLNALRYLFGTEPVRTTDTRATVNDAGLEQTIEWVSHFPVPHQMSTAPALCRSSYLEKLPDYLRITAERGTLTLDPAFTPHARFHLLARYTDAATGKLIEIDETTPRDQPSQFRLEGEDLAQAVAEGREPIAPGEDGLHDLEAIEDIYRESGIPLPGR